MQAILAVTVPFFALVLCGCGADPVPLATRTASYAREARSRTEVTESMRLMREQYEIGRATGRAECEAEALRLEITKLKKEIAMYEEGADYLRRDPDR